jgi:Gly-Xaa carboxypeptidase
MSRILAALEDNPSRTGLVALNPLLGYLECVAEHGQMDPVRRGMVRDQTCWDALADVLERDKRMLPFLGTTQAVDVIRGGVKFNALPEVSRCRVAR